MPAVGVFILQFLHRQAQVHLCAMGGLYRRELILNNGNHLGAVHHLRLLALVGFAETGFDDGGKVRLSHEVLVQLLDTGYLHIVEPIGSLRHPQFIEYLGIELVVVNLAIVVNQLSLRYLQADVSTTACCIRQRMGIVGCCDKRGKAQAVFLGSSKDGASVHLTFRECLLQGSMLTGADSLQLVETHQQVVGQRHLLVELV